MRSFALRCVKTCETLKRVVIGPYSPIYSFLVVNIALKFHSSTEGGSTFICLC